MLDPISDMLTRVRNAQRAGHTEVAFPASKFKEAIANVLKERKFIDGIERIKGKSFDTLKLSLKYYKKENTNKLTPAISQIKRVSSEGQRIYVDKESTRKVKNGLGVAIVSTSKGVLSGEAARKEGVGGELICEVW